MVIKWSACTPSTPTIRVRILLSSTVFSVKFVFEKERKSTNENTGMAKHLFSIKIICWPSFLCAYHPVVQGSNPKHTIYAFSTCSQILYYVCPRVEKRTKINKKRPGFAQNNVDNAFGKNYTKIDGSNLNFSRHFQ